LPGRSLNLHPVSTSPATGIEVDILRVAPDLLSLSYSMRGDMANVIVPQLHPSTRADGLWRHTCFEAFLGARQGYYEFNFSPSTQWAAYRFDSHREGMRELATDGPTIFWDGKAARLIATIRLPSDVTGPLGLSAVVEDRAGNRSFWALAHPPGDPDFHHPACFAAELPPAD